MGIFKPGTFYTSVSNFKKIVKKQNKIRLRDDQTIVGFYDQTLTARLAESLPTPSIIHVDVDLYESTKDILVFLNYLMIGIVSLLLSQMEKRKHLPNF